MYRHEDYEQLKLELPFGVEQREDNRWVLLSQKLPWEAIDREYSQNFTSEEGQGEVIAAGLWSSMHPNGGGLHR